MFKVVNGAVTVVESAFANQNRKDGQALEDIAVEMTDPDNTFHIGSNSKVKLDRAFPPTGLM
jgi:hypothetical protein